MRRILSIRKYFLSLPSNAFVIKFMVAVSLWLEEFLQKVFDVMMLRLTYSFYVYSYNANSDP